jgi:hypothetical protein
MTQATSYKHNGLHACENRQKAYVIRMKTTRQSCTNCRDMAVTAVAPLDREEARLRAYEALLEILGETCQNCKHNRDNNVDDKN